jgi:hypothetical protein
MCAGAAKLEQRRMLPVHTPPLVRSVSRGTARMRFFAIGCMHVLTRS